MADYQFTYLNTVVSRNLSRKTWPAACLALVCSSMIGCGEAPGNNAAAVVDAEPLSIILERWQQQQSLSAVQQTTRLVAETEQFLKEPTEERRATWQTQWKLAHDSWLRASTLIPDPTDSIDPWPIQPGFFDSLPLYPDSGIVNDPTVTLTEAGLRHQHQITDNSEITLGFHVLEHYAFARETRDFEANTIAGERRVLLLRLVSRMLLKDQQALRRQFDLEDNLVPAGLPLTFDGLTRLLHEQLEAVYDGYRQPEQHGEFSDTTPRAIQTSLHTLRELMKETTQLQPYLESIDQDAALTFEQTLEEALALLVPTGPLAESSAARLLLLLASLTHQIEDLIRQLPSETEV